MHNASYFDLPLKPSIWPVLCCVAMHGGLMLCILFLAHGWAVFALSSLCLSLSVFSSTQHLLRQQQITRCWLNDDGLWVNGSGEVRLLFDVQPPYVMTRMVVLSGRCEAPDLSRKPITLTLILTSDAIAGKAPANEKLRDLHVAIASKRFARCAIG